MYMRTRGLRQRRTLLVMLKVALYFRKCAASELKVITISALMVVLWDVPIPAFFWKAWTTNNCGEYYIMSMHNDCIQFSGY